MYARDFDALLWCPDGYVPISEIARTVRRWTKAGKIPDIELVECLIDHGDFPDPLVIGPELLSGRLRSAGVVTQTGQLIALTPTDWRCADWVGDQYLYATVAACQGLEVFVGIPGGGGKKCRAIVAKRDLAIGVGHIAPPSAPKELPPEWIVEEPREAAPPAVVAKAAMTRNGRPLKHDWEAFWIAVAHYAAANDLIPENRTELQRHMESWATRVDPDDPMDSTTIRRRLQRLFAYDAPK